MTADSDLGWINDYVGIPYRINGRDRRGWDCWGLVVAVYRDQKGLELPDWHQRAPYDLASRVRDMDLALEAMGGDLMEQLEAPAPWSIVFASTNRRPHHVGVVLGAGVLHCAETTSGTVYDSLSRFSFVFPGRKTWWAWRS